MSRSYRDYAAEFNSLMDDSFDEIDPSDFELMRELGFRDMERELPPLDIPTEEELIDMNERYGPDSVPF